MIYKTTTGGLLVEHLNETQALQDVYYACLTAPEVVKCEIMIDGKLVEVVYAGAGGSHSWWTAAGGKFFPPDVAPGGLPPGSRLQVRVSGECALRIDWI